MSEETINRLKTDVELLKQSSRTHDRDIERIERDINEKVTGIHVQLDKFQEETKKRFEESARMHNRAAMINQSLLALILVTLIVSSSLLGFSETSRALNQVTEVIERAG